MAFLKELKDPINDCPGLISKLWIEYPNIDDNRNLPNLGCVSMHEESEAKEAFRRVCFKDVRIASVKGYSNNRIPLCVWQVVYDLKDPTTELNPHRIGDTSDQPKDKRLKTTIVPEQLDYLHQKYQIESRPSRKMLENIAREVGLKKRVVEVWFQNSRAKERKGQFRARPQVINKRCPFCPAFFKVKSALESHLITKHAARGEVNIDALPDEEVSLESSPSLSSGGDNKFQQNANMMPPLFPTLHPDMDNSIKKYYEESMKRYISELDDDSKDSNSSGPISLKLPDDQSSLNKLYTDITAMADFLGMKVVRKYHTENRFHAVVEYTPRRCQCRCQDFSLVAEEPDVVEVEMNFDSMKLDM